MLGKIKTVPLRNIWKNEALDFTPWLATNLAELGDAVGLELEFEDKEVSVGPYSADILAKDTGTGQFVVIENQLEKTNHDHLGKCIVYSSILNASAVIWVASDFTEEHKKALDWLNDHTSDDISFYGVKIDLLQIDDSPPAIQFNVKSTPNEIVRQAAKRKDQGDLTETRKLQYDFWTVFKEKLKLTNKISALQTPRPQYWFDVALGKSGVHLSNTFNTWENKIGVRVYIGNKEADEWLPYFESHKERIEKEIGSKLEWNPNPENRDKVIVLTKFYKLDDKEKWEEPISWLVEQTIKFRNTFSKLIREKKREI
ncbi:MAG: DUF4268 domain-containing protein [Ignavibacteriaceae bacterium]|nr:DUF4268 domain-containing protein [Ignavibacteriaceae bacterium]